MTSNDNGNDKPGTVGIDKLNQIYHEANECDTAIFAEQRSNVLLVSGDHYTRKGSKFWNRIRDNKDLSNEQRLRLTKNHLQRICKTYVNNITQYAPSVTITPAHESSIQDMKSAELNSSVWQWLRKRHDIRQKTRDWIKDYVDIGEVAVKIFWDPMAGDFKGYNQAVSPEGMPMFEADGSPSADKQSPQFTGDLVYERVFGFNLLRAPEAKSMGDSRYLIVRKMVNTDELKLRVGDDEEKLKYVTESKDETFMIFDGSRGEYTATRNQTMLKELYYKPSPQYPMGYYYIYTTNGILWQGELPFGIFPIVYQGFDSIPTTPRHVSIVKQLRPYQAEINRAASQIAMHQITLGDDKIIYQSGSKIENGSYLPGIRGLKISGPPPTILPGRSGDQYLPYIQSQIAEMYQIADLELDSAEVPKDLDPYTAMYMSLRDKKKLSVYGEKIESLLLEICEKSLDMSRKYLPDDMLIPALGKREQINIPEFKTSDRLGYHIELEPQSDDIETKLGHQLTMNHILQYVGTSLDKDDIGMMIRNMPYGNLEESFADFTMDYDNIKNDMLALERGQYRPAKPGDAHVKYIKKLSSRMKQPDFEFLNPQVKIMYDRKIQEHEQLQAQELQQIQMAESGFIPSTGYAVTVDFYVPNPSDPKKPQRARVPYDSLKWLLEKLEGQGTTQQALSEIPQGELARMGQMISPQNQSGAAQPGIQAAPPPPMMAGQPSQGRM